MATDDASDGRHGCLGGIRQNEGDAGAGQCRNEDDPESPSSLMSSLRSLGTGVDETFLLEIRHSGVVEVPSETLMFDPRVP